MITVETKKYKPWDGSRDCPKLFHQNPARFRLIVAGIQSGKTIAGVNEAIRQMVKEAPGSTGMAIAPTFPILEQIVLPEIFRWLPPRKVEGQTVWNYLKTEKRLDLANGSVCFFRHADDPDSLRGPRLNWFYGDEIALWPHDAWLILEGRTSIGLGRGWGTGTPKGYNWVFDLFQKTLLKDPNYSDYKFFTWKSIDSPYFDPNEVERVKKIYSEAYFRQEYEASFESYVGRVYPEFNVNTHVIEPFVIPDTWDLYESIDPAIRMPTAVAFLAVDFDGRVYQYEEHYVEEETVPWHAQKIKEKREKEPLMTLMDPSAFSRTPQAGQSIAEEYAQNGILAVPADNNLMTGIDRVKQYLNPDSPRFFVFKNCVHTIDEFLGYEWAAGRVGGDAKEKPRKIRDHMCLAEGTIIHCLDGDKPIEELVGQTGYVFCYRHDKKRIGITSFTNVVSTGIRPVMRIHLEDGNYLDVTHDHLFLLRRSLAYKPAESLTPRNSLMPLYRNLHRSGYMYVRTQPGGEWAHRLVYEDCLGSLSEDSVVHHKDENPLNNLPSNLELLPRAEHNGLHAKKRNDGSAIKLAQEKDRFLWTTDEQYRLQRQAHLMTIQEKAKAWHASPEGHEWHRQHSQRVFSKHYDPRAPQVQKECRQCGEEFSIPQIIAKRTYFCSNNCRSTWRRHQGVDNEERICGVCGKPFMINKYSKPQNRSYSCCGRSNKSNHQIAKVEFLKIEVPVYNLLTVAGNFAAGGVIVHNCDALRYFFMSQPEAPKTEKESTLGDKVRTQLKRKRDEQSLDFEMGDSW